MTERVQNAKVGASQAELMIGWLSDALEEAVKVLRTFGESDLAAATVKEFERRELVRRLGRAERILTPLDKMVAFLSSTDAPDPYTSEQWNGIVTARMNLVELISKEADKTEQAVQKAALRGWFVGQFVNTNPPNVTYQDCGKLVTLAFKAGMK